MYHIDGTNSATSGPLGLSLSSRLESKLRQIHLPLSIYYNCVDSYLLLNIKRKHDTYDDFLLRPKRHNYAAKISHTYSSVARLERRRFDIVVNESQQTPVHHPSPLVPNAG